MGDREKVKKKEDDKPSTGKAILHAVDFVLGGPRNKPVPEPQLPPSRKQRVLREEEPGIRRIIFKKAGGGAANPRIDAGAHIVPEEKERLARTEAKSAEAKAPVGKKTPSPKVEAKAAKPAVKKPEAEKKAEPVEKAPKPVEKKAEPPKPVVEEVRMPAPAPRIIDRGEASILPEAPAPTRKKFVDMNDAEKLQGKMAVYEYEDVLRAKAKEGSASLRQWAQELKATLQVSDEDARRISAAANILRMRKCPIPGHAAFISVAHGRFLKPEAGKQVSPDIDEKSGLVIISNVDMHASDLDALRVAAESLGRVPGDVSYKIKLDVPAGKVFLIPRVENLPNQKLMILLELAQQCPYKVEADQAVRDFQKFLKPIEGKKLAATLDRETGEIFIENVDVHAGSIQGLSMAGRMILHKQMPSRTYYAVEPGDGWVRLYPTQLQKQQG